MVLSAGNCSFLVRGVRGRRVRIRQACIERRGKAATVTKDILSILSQRCGREFVVAVEDGFGNREWLWFPPFAQGELEAWWSTLADIATFWHERTRKNWPGEFIRMDEDPELSELWAGLWTSGPLRARVDMNEQLDLARPETYLQRSDGTFLLHKGAVGIGGH
jgi:hypothetical protein